MKAFGVARIGRDVEIRYSPSGDPVAGLSLAFSTGKKGKDDKYETTWVDASLWGKRAESLSPYLLKGAQIGVSLRDVRIQKYVTRDGTEASKLVADVVDIDLVGSKREESTPAAKPAPRPAPSPAPKQKSSSGFDDMDDDLIPF